MNGRRFSILSVWLSLALAIVLGCERPPTTALERAQASYRKGNWKETAVLCDELLRQDPNDRWGLLLRGKAYLAMQQFENSIADFSKLAELDSTDHEVYYYRSMAYEGLGDQALAEADRAKGRELDPLRNAAYTYSPKNFVPQSAPITPPRSSAEPAEDKKLLSELDSSAVGKDDFETGPTAAIRLPRPSRQPGKTQHDEEYIRDAVDDFRRMIADTDPANRPKETSSKAETQRSPGSLPNLKVDPGKALAGDEPKSDGVANKKTEKPTSEVPSNKPTLSTALPPGYAPMGGLPQTQSPYVVAAQPGSLPTIATAPITPRTGTPPLTTQVPYAPYGIPGLSGATGQTIIQPNTIHAPGSKPVLSTSLPAGTLQRGVPGIGNPPPAAVPYTTRPPMLPRPVRRIDVP